MSSNIEELAAIAEFVLYRVFFSVPATKTENDITVHPFADRQYTYRGHKHTLKQWSLLANHLPLKKGLSLRSKTNTPNSIDPNDLHYQP